MPGYNCSQLKHKGFVEDSLEDSAQSHSLLLCFFFSSLFYFIMDIYDNALFLCDVFTHTDAKAFKCH